MALNDSFVCVGEETTAPALACVGEPHLELLSIDFVVILEIDEEGVVVVVVVVVVGVVGVVVSGTTTFRTDFHPTLAAVVMGGDVMYLRPFEPVATVVGGWTLFN